MGGEEVQTGPDDEDEYDVDWKVKEARGEGPLARRVPRGPNTRGRGAPGGCQGVPTSRPHTAVHALASYTFLNKIDY